MKDVLITSSALILALLVLRRLFRNTLSRRMQYALWGLVLVRLLIPLSLPAVDFSVLTAAQPVEQAVTERVSGRPVYVPVARAPLSEHPNAPDLSPERVELPEADSVWVARDEDTAVQYKRLSVEALLSVIWKAGIALMGGFFVLSNAAFYLRLRKRREPFSPSEPISRKIYIAPEGVLPSPCLFGGSIYLTPAAAASPDALRHVLAHEETHARHLDPLWALLRGVCLTVYWFDPLVWIAAACSKADCELACDEGALKRLGEQERIPYGQTLLSLIPVRKGLGNPLTTATTMTAGKRQLRERITRIAHRPKQFAAAVAAVLVLVGIASACTFTGANQPASEPPRPAAPAPELVEPEPVISLVEPLRYELAEIPFYEALSLSDGEEVAILDAVGTRVLLAVMSRLAYDDPRFHEEGYGDLTRALEIFDTVQGRAVRSIELPDGVICASAALLDEDTFGYVTIELQESGLNPYRIEVCRNGAVHTAASGRCSIVGDDDPKVVSLGGGSFAYSYHDDEAGTFGVNVVSAQGEITPQITLTEDRPYYCCLYGDRSRYVYYVSPYASAADDEESIFAGDETGVIHQFSLPDSTRLHAGGCRLLKDRILFTVITEDGAKQELLVTDLKGNPLVRYPCKDFYGIASDGNSLAVGNDLSWAPYLVRVTDQEVLKQKLDAPASAVGFYSTMEREFLLHYERERKLMRLSVP